MSTDLPNPVHLQGTFTLECKECGSPLTAEVVAIDALVKIRIDPCSKCLEDANNAGYHDGCELFEGDG